MAWFNRPPPSSISSFRELSIAFVSHFIGARTYRKPGYHLLTIKQSSQESLRSYVQRFNDESLKVDIPDEKFVITAFIASLGVQSKDLMFSISENPQESMAEVLAKEEKYINGEESLISKKESSSTYKEKSGTDKRRGRSPKRQSHREGYFLFFFQGRCCPFFVCSGGPWLLVLFFAVVGLWHLGSESQAFRL